MTKFGLGTALLCVGLINSAYGLEATVERSSLFSLNAGDVIEDAGTITVISKASSRTEAFETIRHQDGTRTITSVMTDSDGAYRVEGRWSYDDTGLTSLAQGRGSYNGVPVEVEIATDPPTATLSVKVGGQERTVTTPCSEDCFIDLSPSVMAMFAITRQFTANSQDTKSFQWIGQALHRDVTLTEGGRSDVRLHGTHTLHGLTVLQFLFYETLPGAENAEAVEAAFNLYVDATYRPLAFATSRGTIATRSGFETVIQSLPPVFNE